MRRSRRSRMMPLPMLISRREAKRRAWGPEERLAQCQCRKSQASCSTDCPQLPKNRQKDCITISHCFLWRPQHSKTELLGFILTLFLHPKEERFSSYINERRPIIVQWIALSDLDRSHSTAEHKRLEPSPVPSPVYKLRQDKIRQIFFKVQSTCLSSMLYGNWNEPKSVHFGYKNVKICSFSLKVTFT